MIILIFFSLKFVKKYNFYIKIILYFLKDIYFLLVKKQEKGILY